MAEVSNRDFGQFMNWYRQAGIEVVQEEMQINGFSFRHDLETRNLQQEQYLFSGHLHPGVRISGMGKQSLRLPCFYFTTAYCILPAFSRFTGTALVRPVDGENVFAIANNKIVQLQ